MYVTAGGRASDEELGNLMSRMELESNLCDNDGKAIPKASSSSSSQRPESNLNKFEYHELAHETKLRSRPNEQHGKVGLGKRDFMVSPVTMLARREGNYSGRGRFSSADCCHISSRYLPVNGPWLVDQMNSRVYVSQFSNDGSLCVAGFQGSQVRVYNVEKGWKLQKNILAKSLMWTITDTSLSSDQRYLIYASMSPVVHIVNIGSQETESYANITEIHEGLNFSTEEIRGNDFAIFSVKFSSDGKEIVAGTGDDSICVYDLNANQLSLRISAHTADVNTVCFADESNNLIYSGSDDALCKVWDRRCFSTAEKPAGILMGHLEGITFIDSKGDGRYFISNGKDQCIKLWDIRTMSSNASCNVVQTHRDSEWDYRWRDYPPEAKNAKHPYDKSIFTYRGHSVLRTLIRCHFSPAYSTGQKYIYTGSHNACVHVYDLISGDQVATLKHHKSPVRDCSWHPYYPILVSSSWDGDVVKWEFPGNGEAPIPTKKRTRRRQPI